MKVSWDDYSQYMEKCSRPSTRSPFLQVNNRECAIYITMLNYWRVNTETPGKKTTDPAVIKHGNGDLNGRNHLINS